MHYDRASSANRLRTLGMRRAGPRRRCCWPTCLAWHRTGPMGKLLLSVCVAFVPCLSATVASGRGLELRLEGVYAMPLGQYTIQGFTVDADSLVSNGYGALGAALYRINEHLACGVGFGYYRTHGGDLFDLFGAEATLEAVPLHALVEARARRGALGLLVEGGFGYTHGWLDARGILPGGFDLARLGRSEGNASFLLGGSASLDLGRNWGLVAGVKYHQTFTTFDISENAVKFLLVSAGVRYGGR
jgi:hypothetical protein